VEQKCSILNFFHIKPQKENVFHVTGKMGMD